jgi:CheY-specific phosphatase CheX
MTTTEEPVKRNEADKAATATASVKATSTQTQPQQQQVQQQPPSSPEIPTPTNTFVPPNLDNLLIELKQKKEMVRRLDEELYYLRHVNADLAEKERLSQERMINRQKDQKQLLDNYNDHIRSRRATNDDAASIHKKLQDLKAMIKTLSVEFGNHCDASVATKAISSFWVNLNEPILKLGDPLPINSIVMLTEKFLMDVLVQNMNYNTFTGLKISQPYTQLQMWFERYEVSFCTRLRQEMAKVVVSGNLPNSDIQAEIQKLNKRMYISLYTSLLKAYPFIEQHDATLVEKDTNKQYSVMLRTMVEYASDIGYAMRGQEVEIAAAAVGEGSELFDPKTMVDEDGQTSGIIQFCVCPPFIMYGARVEILEKARVLCSPLPANANNPATAAAPPTAQP